MKRPLTCVLIKPFLVLAATVIATSGTAAAQTPFSERDVSFNSSGVVLSGTLVLPPKMVAAVVVVHGSGQEERMLPFARELADYGLAALTYDKRGVGRSGGTYMGPEVGTNNVDASNLRQLAEDAAAGVEDLVHSLPDKHLPIGLIGFSQAGWIIPQAANMSSNVRFVVLFSGPVVSAREQLRFQDFTQQDARFWDQHSEREVRNRISSRPDRFTFVDTDPRDALRSLSAPGLWLFGGRDVNVPVQLSVERLQPLIAQGRHFSYHVFPRMRHQLEERDVLPIVMQWIAKSVPRAGSSDPTK
jgi:uncharacterized protein